MPESSTTTVPASVDADAKFEVVIHGSVEDVWEEITRTDRPIPAFFNARMDTRGLAPGNAIAMRTPDGTYTGVVGEVLGLDPPRRFVHTFKFTAYDDPACIVAYDLEPVADGVRFTLTIHDLPTGTKTAKQMTQGGRLIVNTLKSVIETGRPSFGTRCLFTLFKVLGFTTPKRCRSEHWPV